MKTMKEVFNGNPCGFSPRMTDEQVRYAQHAINCHDDLKNSLMEMIDLASRIAVVCKFDLELRPEYQKAKEDFIKAESIQ